jgi:hypothetical protein
LRDIDA